MYQLWIKDIGSPSQYCRQDQTHRCCARIRHLFESSCCRYTIKILNRHPGQYLEFRTLATTGQRHWKQKPPCCFTALLSKNMFLEFISDTSNVIPPKTLDVSQGTEVIPPHQRVNLSGKPKRAPAPEPPSISEDLQIKKKHLLILCTLDWCPAEVF